MTISVKFAGVSGISSVSGGSGNGAEPLRHLRSRERRPLSNLSVSHPLDSSPGRRALGKEGSFSMKPTGAYWKTSRDAKASPTRGGGIERSEDDGEVVQSCTCVIPLPLKASFVQPLSLAAARQPFPFRHFRATSPGRGSLSWQGSH